ncbi:hypothetical protein D3C86_1031870 [compost metagenome]
MADLEIEAKTKTSKALNSLRSSKDLPEYLELMHELLSLITDLGSSRLSQYVVHRRAILTLLEKSLEIKEDGTYALESNIHELIFPQRTTSDDIEFESQNLWLIDERLAFHHFLSSDKPLGSVVKGSGAAQRPDLIVFDNPLAYTEASPVNSVVIVEFKRPERDEYSDDDNPINQVYGYIQKINDAKAKNAKGQTISVGSSARYYCYVIATLTPKIRTYAKYASLKETPDGHGYYGYNEELRAYVEVISFDKLVADAFKRNKVLFEKLNLPTT